MAEDLCISNGGKEEKYRMLLPQIKCLIEGEDDLIANLANVAAALKETFHFFWVGFYLVKGEELVLAPFQGPVACTRIKKGRGVCGTAWERGSAGCTGCGCFPGTYSMQLFVAFGNSAPASSCKGRSMGCAGCGQ